MALTAYGQGQQIQRLIITISSCCSAWSVSNMQGTETTEEQSTPRNAYCPHSYDAFIRFNVPLADSMCTDMYPYLYYTRMAGAILIFL